MDGIITYKTNCGYRSLVAKGVRGESVFARHIHKSSVDVTELYTNRLTHYLTDSPVLYIFILEQTLRN